MLSLTEAIDCNELEELNQLSEKHDFRYFWQMQTPEHVYTYDRMQAGFFDEYYGKDLDMKCPVAWAYRSRMWPVFSFLQARQEPRFQLLDPHKDSDRVWSDHGATDGLLILSGHPGLDSFVVFGFSHEVKDPQIASLPFIALSRKLDIWLKDKSDLTCVKREFTLLSPKERLTLKVQIDNPHLSIKAQAGLLGISEATLNTRHERIAKKFNVKRFTGAALLAERTKFFS